MTIAEDTHLRPLEFMCGFVICVVITLMNNKQNQSECEISPEYILRKLPMRFVKYTATHVLSMAVYGNSRHKIDF